MDTAILDTYVRQLQSPDTEQRKQAILALGRSKHPAALRPLAEVYNRETVAELRDLALRAGQFIKMQNGGAVADGMEAEITNRPTRVRSRVPASTAKAARQLAEDAILYNSQNEINKAIKALDKALQMDPSLANDSYFLSIASTVLRAEEEQAVALLNDDARRSEIVKTADEQKKAEEAEAHLQKASSLSWLAAAFDLVIYTLIVVLGPVLFVLVVSQAFETWQAANPNEASAAVEQAEEFTQAINTSSLLALAATAAVCGVAGLLIQCAAIHFSATRFLGGKGTFRYLIYKLVSYYNKILLTVFLVAGLTAWVAIGQGMPILNYAVGAGLALYGLLKFIRLGDKISEAYKFGTGGGCLSVLIASFVLVVVNGAIAYAMYLILGNILVTMLPSL